ncbi:MAG: UDP-N-acetylmuramate dehydrogenase [Eubacteriales bacterium]
MDNTIENENRTRVFFRILSESGNGDLCLKIKINEPLSRHTTMRVGGSADLYAEPSGLLEVAALFHAAQKSGLPVFVMGNGSNLVVSDLGIEGLVIGLGDALSRIWFEEDPLDKKAVLVHSYAGALLSQVAVACAKRGLAGMEFAAGIPGSIGGAVFMNAGAYGNQMSDVVYKSVSLTPQGDMLTLTGQEHAFDYRKSYFLTNGGIVLSVVLRLYPGESQTIMAKIIELNGKRAASQPLTMPSAGSAFRRPEGYYAGALIQDAGLKGYRVGGAQVSEKHAGFIVNAGQATAKDIYDLAELIKEKVYRDTGVILEPEIRFVGRGY